MVETKWIFPATISDEVKYSGLNLCMGPIGFSKALRLVEITNTGTVLLMQFNTAYLHVYIFLVAVAFMMSV